MSFGFEIDHESNLVTVTIDDTSSPQDRSKILDDLVGILLKNPTLNLILDVSEAEHHMSDEEKISFGESLAEKQPYFKQSKTAFITRKEQNKFSIILSAAYVNGFKRLAEFGNKREAKMWFSGEIY